MLSGVEFVELASQGGYARWFEQLLVALGFQKTHQHKSKDVHLYRQGGINFIVNCEPDSFAQQHYEKHGTAVCALGLATTQLPELVERCRKHHCDFYETSVLPGEMAIPAIRTIWDGLLYLVDRTPGAPHFYEVDFEALPGMGSEAPQGFGLTRIDHITQAVAPAEFLAQVQFYKVLFDLEANPEHDLKDAHGVVHSQSLVNKTHTVQFPVNTSHEPASSTERFRNRFSGSGVQHLAMQCDDIFHVAEHLNPHNILPIPAAYYAELKQNFGLDDALLEKMNTFNVMYDRNESGELFHIYTRHINGLFFEIVQRNHYAGFGERNAATRLAAQEQEYQKLKALLLE
ncbi:MAG: hypothetical protein R3F02_11285 [Thiolinea sp.]